MNNKKFIEVKEFAKREDYVGNCELIQWFVKDGEDVCKDQKLFTVENEKVTCDYHATNSGRIKILVKENEKIYFKVPVGYIVTNETFG